jgi:hypothetical protein
MNKYDRCHSDWGPSHFTALPETFIEADFAEDVMLLPIDEVAEQATIDNLLLEVGANGYMIGDKVIKSDLIVFVPTGWPHIDPSREVMGKIVKMGIKVHMVRGDSGGPHGHEFTESWFPFVTSIGFVDMGVAHLGYQTNPKAIQAFPCLNGKYFYDKHLERDIDVSFVGSIGNWERRGEYLDFLRSQGIKVMTAGGGEYDSRISTEEYSDIINRSKISLNFCLHRAGEYSQLKGRVLDIMGCRTCLIEDEGEETKNFFEDGKDFIMVRSKEEMADKVRYYLSHDHEREEIAQSGYQKVKRLYNSWNLWAYILEKLGFEIPVDIAIDDGYRELKKKLEVIRGKAN